MDPEEISIVTNIWLGGNPVFSLIYENHEKFLHDFFGDKIYADLSGFRPDPADYLIKGDKYKAVLTFQREKDHHNTDQWILRRFVSNGQKFVYIR